MNLKNYTSSVPVETSVSLIERELVRNGAANILKKYEGGEIRGIQFQICKPGHPEDLVMISLPANVDTVFKVLMQEVRRPRPGTEEKVREQAARTAWKIVYDWVTVQMSLIRLGQAEFLQVFVGYALVGDQTFYQRLKSGKFLALENQKDL